MVIVILVSLVASFMIQNSTTSSKQITDEYLRSQAKILAISATEFAILAISAHDRSTNCITDITLTYPPRHQAKINIQYIGKTASLSACSNILAQSPSIVPQSDITTIIDVEVTSTHGANGTSEPIRIFRRTIQKP